jgi:hypothetical protein
MKDFTLLSIGETFKKCECYTLILLKCQASPHNTKKKLKNPKIAKKGGPIRNLLDYGAWPAGDRWLPAGLGPLTIGRRSLVAH